MYRLEAKQKCPYGAGRDEYADWAPVARFVGRAFLSVEEARETYKNETNEWQKNNYDYRAVQEKDVVTFVTYVSVHYGNEFLQLEPNEEIARSKFVIKKEAY